MSKLQRLMAGARCSWRVKSTSRQGRMNRQNEHEAMIIILLSGIVIIMMLAGSLHP